MIDLEIDKVLPGQYALRIDPRYGVIMPWYTHGALDDLAARDLSDKVVVEWGGGLSTFWWSRACRQVYTIEANQDWTEWIVCTAREKGFDNLSVRHIDPEGFETEYLKLPVKPDIVCIDGSLRTECLEVALSLPRPLTIIFDNWMQDGIYFDVEMEKKMTVYPGRFYIQADHKDHQGHPWQTAIWDLV